MQTLCCDIPIFHSTYRISANSFRGNYSFLNLALFTVTFDLYYINLNSCRGNYSRAETIRGYTVVILGFELVETTIWAKVLCI